MPESVAFAYNGSNTMTATVTGATNGDTYGMWSDQGTSSDSDVAAGGVANLSIGISALAAGFGVDVFVQHGAPFSNTPYIGTTRFCYGSTSECCFDATWSFDGDRTICVTFTLPNIGVNAYFLQLYDQGPSGVGVVAVTATGSPQTECVSGSAAANTTASGVNAVDSATLNVASTTGFSATGWFYLSGAITAYTGKTATSFTGCGAHPATTGGELVDIPLIGGIVAQLSRQSDFETYATRLFTQDDAGAGYPGQPGCFLPQIYRRL